MAEEKGCPLCQFIEAGPCKVPHEEWVSCRKNAKEQKKDYVTECSETFRTFLQCTLEHDDYYQPFLEMLGLDKVSKEGEKLDEEIKGSAMKQ